MIGSGLSFAFYLYMQWRFLVSIGWIFFASLSMAATSLPYGYTDDPAAEREQKFNEIFVMQEKPLLPERSLSDRIFNDRLKKEFKVKYEEKFGHNETERVYFHAGQVIYNDVSSGSYERAEEYTHEQKAFGEFMIKRLVEYHVDDYAKSEPKVRPLWELKEEISNIKVEVSKGYRLDLNYSYSGNYLDIYLLNPFVDSKVTVEMDPHSFGPTTPQETKYVIGYGFSPRVHVETSYAVVDGISTFGIRRQIRPDLEGSIVNSTFTHLNGASIRETKTLFSLAWIY